MPSKSLNKNLQAAKSGKNDEFYTQRTDIEKELRHYKAHFRNKTVFCNCDDPRISNFFSYFADSFEQLKLKKLITTCFKNQNADLFSQNKSETAVKLEYNGDRNGNRTPDPEEIGIIPLRGDGDFRSPESVALLQEADIVVTNPPFSLFRAYVEQLIAHNKKFLIIGSQQAITYKEIFKLLKEDKLWLGVDNNGTKWFQVNEEYDITTESRKKMQDGKKYFSMGSVVWFTNLDIAKRHDELILVQKYSPEKHLKYDNYDAINVDKVTDIPYDYPGAMGVPITFLDKHNPDQFELLGITDRDDNSGLKSKVYTANDARNFADLNRRGVIIVNGEYKQTFVRLFIRNRNPQ
ncbi:hypothetical protein HNQ93_004420 [Hymenobacter luteus]|uniref:Modification methylase n=2 Tax=Hymenobacter TaxID=89966 RepID=A0A7W9WD22_9BACT|nr:MULTISPECIES: adenine-specific methyltransferase EcoRI family protein [Hymenobacter]MBB4603758.1 hypothetical protein [Hymenobacter latericoloratus]MBB6061539.1 hypothetical protein [Hymenobacter luteus]